MIYKLIFILISGCFFPMDLFQMNNTINSDVKSIEKKLEIKIVYNKIESDTWNKSRYKIVKSKTLLKRYLKLIEQEYSKYPIGYLKKAKAGILVLVENYSFNGNAQAAMPDPYSNKLFLAIDGAYGDKSDQYLIHTMHHELQHCTEYVIWNDQYYKWDAWAELNKPGFQYGQGGISAYKDMKTDYSSMNNPEKGFLNLYSMLGQEEDRAEIFACMMSDIERPDLHALCKKDDIVRKKIQKMIELINKFSGVSGNNAYWEKNNAICIKE